MIKQPEVLAHILVVDDDDRLRTLLGTYLQRQGYRVSLAEDAKAARRFLQHFTVDLIVMDIMMPGESGLELLADLRQSIPTPILLLTAMAESQERITGFETGADDYLTKPFEPRELDLRIQSILRRSTRSDISSDNSLSSDQPLWLGARYFDPTHGVLVDKDETPVALTSAELTLLRELAQNPGKTLSRLELARRCGHKGGSRSIDAQVARLRRKLEPDPANPRFLCTVHGRGYVLRPSV